MLLSTITMQNGFSFLGPEIQPSPHFPPVTNSHKAAFCKAFISVIYSFSTRGVSKQTMALKYPVPTLRFLFAEYSLCLTLNEAQDSVRVDETVMRPGQSAEVQRAHQIHLMSLDVSRLREKPSNLLSGCMFITFCQSRLQDMPQS